MTPERWQKIRRVLEAAVELSPAQREAFLQTAAKEDPELRDEVDSLLARDRSDSFLHDPAVQASDILRLLQQESKLEVGKFLHPGARLGNYAVLSSLGSGGMGEVYKARDVRLGREVAIKVLPEAFSADRERLVRFEREAKLLAALSHANVATLYELQESGGRPLLVMELVEGETLAERIARGPMGIDEATPLFVGIADGLEAAHEKGIIHRDLKPANIKIQPNGKPKILDFGLAKVLAEDPSRSDLAESPTVTKGTALGVILGTAAYMSPEQARGARVGKGTDVWAFGCCLYEALSGEKAFQRESLTDTLAAVVSMDVDWSRLPPATPTRVKRLLRRCLQKDARERLRDVGDAGIELKDSFEDSTAPTAVPRWPSVLWVALLLAGVLAGALAARFLYRAPVAPRVVKRFNLALTNLDVSATESAPALAISRDGTRLVYVASVDGRPRLHLREMASLEQTPLRGTDGARGPFFSPRGDWVAFFADGKLKKVPVGGGTATILCEAPVPRGGSWGEDGRLYFALTGAAGIFRVSESGGTLESVSKPKSELREATHRWPDVLPGGRGLLFAIGTGESFNDARVVVLDLATGEHSTVIEGGTGARYVDGHVVFGREGALWGAPFDAETLQIEGPAVQLLDDVKLNRLGGVQYALSQEGTLAYVPAAAPLRTELVWVDRKGAFETIFAEDSLFLAPRLSPDGTRLAYSTLGENIDIWTYHLVRRTVARVTSLPHVESRPLWSPEGASLFYLSDDESGRWGLFRRTADGSGATASVVEPAQPIRIPTSLTRDGTVLAYTELHPQNGWDIWTIETTGGVPRPFLAESFNERHAMFSPDGRYIVYVSDESGRDEVYVRGFSSSPGKWPISNEGGTQPQWSRDGRELFYRNGNKMMVVSLDDGSFSPGEPRVLFDKAFSTGNTEADYTPNYDVSLDGRKFVMVALPANVSNEVRVVLDWFPQLGASSRP